MAAGCEINGCDVIAVGRCSSCGLAFCKSHQSLTSTVDTATSKCAMCERKTAGCEINGCDVTAVGRCISCRLVFCTSHQSSIVVSGSTVKQCTLCAQKTEKGRRQIEEQLGEAKERIHIIVRMLDEAGVRKTKYFHAKKWRQRGILYRTFGHDQQVEDPERHEYGWLVGEYLWWVEYTEGSGYYGGAQNKWQRVMIRTYGVVMK